MPRRARSSVGTALSEAPSNVTRPPRGRSSPMMLLSSVVLPTPLRPIRQTAPPLGTVRLTSRNTRPSPYEPLSCSSVSTIALFPSEIDLDHARVALHQIHRSLEEQRALVQHGHGLRDLTDEGHVVLDDQDRLILSDRRQ